MISSLMMAVCDLTMLRKLRKMLFRPCLSMMIQIKYCFVIYMPCKNHTKLLQRMVAYVYLGNIFVSQIIWNFESMRFVSLPNSALQSLSIYKMLVVVGEEN